MFLMCSSTEMSFFISILKYYFFSINVFTSVSRSKWSRREVHAAAGSSQEVIRYNYCDEVIDITMVENAFWDFFVKSFSCQAVGFPVEPLFHSWSPTDPLPTEDASSETSMSSSWMSPTYLLTISQLQPSYCKLCSSNSSQTDRLSSQLLGIDWAHNLLYLLVNKLQLLIQNWTELNTLIYRN